jgi:hypothetical protein
MTKTFQSAVLILALASRLHAQSEFSPQAMLKPKPGVLYTIPPNLDARGAYDTLGAKSGINMVYLADFKQDTPVVLRIEGQTFFEAMSRLSEETKTFWFPWDSKTIVLAPEGQRYRRDLEPLTFKIFYLGKDTTPEVMLKSVTALRTQLQMRGVMQQEAAKAIVVRDTAANVAAAERILSEVSGQSLPLPATTALAFPENTTFFVLLAENGKARRVVPSTQSHLENTLSGSVSVDMNTQARPIYEDLASRAGINVIFDRDMREKPATRFHVEGLDIINTLDLLALQTSTFWQPMNESTIFVTNDNQQNRRDRDTFIVKVLFLPETASTTDLLGTLNILRISPGLRGIFHDDKHKAIVIRDTPLRVFLAEKTVEDLNKRLGKSTSVAITTDTSSVYAENGWILGNAAAARPKLEVKLRNKTTVRMNETPKAAFEALTELGGLKVLFDPRFTDSAEISFNANNIDILDAIDLLAWQTRQYWEVVDEHTIRITPDSQAGRRGLELAVEKTIVPSDPTDAAALMNILRTAFGLRSVYLDEKNNTILVRDLADNVRLAEKIIEILGKGAVQQ